MFFLFSAGLFLFFAARAAIYFLNGRAFAGSFAVLACMLFAGGIYADFAMQKSKAAKQTAQSTI